MCYSMQISCDGTECMMLKKHNELLIKVTNSTKKPFHMPRQGNFNPSYKKGCGVCAVKYKTGSTTTKEGSGSYFMHMIQWHDSKASRGCVVV